MTPHEELAAENAKLSAQVIQCARLATHLLKHASELGRTDTMCDLRALIAEAERLVPVSQVMLSDAAEAQGLRDRLKAAEHNFGLQLDAADAATKRAEVAEAALADAERRLAEAGYAPSRHPEQANPLGRYSDFTEQQCREALADVSGALHDLLPTIVVPADPRGYARVMRTYLDMPHEQAAADSRCREALARVERWTHEHGAALKPPRADSYGEGMRDAKEQVATIVRAALAGTTPVGRPAESHAQKRLAALRAEKKYRLRAEHGIVACESCSADIHTETQKHGVDYFTDSEDGIYLCSTCYQPEGWPAEEPSGTAPERATVNSDNADVAQVAAALADAHYAGGLSEPYYREADAALRRLAARPPDGMPEEPARDEPPVHYDPHGCANALCLDKTARAYTRNPHRITCQWCRAEAAEQWGNSTEAEYNGPIPSPLLAAAPPTVPGEPSSITYTVSPGFNENGECVAPGRTFTVSVDAPPTVPGEPPRGDQIGAWYREVDDDGCEEWQFSDYSVYAIQMGGEDYLTAQWRDDEGHIDDMDIPFGVVRRVLAEAAPPTPPRAPVDEAAVRAERDWLAALVRRAIELDREELEGELHERLYQLERPRTAAAPRAGDRGAEAMSERQPGQRWVDDCEGRRWFFDADTDDRRSVQWALRYGEPTRAELLLAAAILADYHALVVGTRLMREQACRALRDAMSEVQAREIGRVDAPAEPRKPPSGEEPKP